MSKVETGLYYPIKLDELPSSWTAGYVGDFADTVQPGFASGKHNKGGVGIPHLRPMNVDQDGKVSMDEVKFVSPDKDKKRLQVGDVLFNNTNSPVWVGKTAHVAQAKDLAFSNHMTRVVFNDDVSPKYGALQLHYLWMSGYFLHRCTKHVNQASISSKTLADTVPFVIPDRRDTQDRIVAEVEKQFSRLDEAVASLKRVKANLKRYKAAILKAAVEGKLTEEWRKQNPDVEPASMLLERILSERRTKWEEAELAKMKAKGKVGSGKAKKYKEPAATDASDLVHLPSGWQWISADTISILITDGKHGDCKDEDGSGYFFLSAKDVKGGKLVYEGAREIIQQEFAEVHQRTNLELGDVLITNAGTIGRIAVATDNDRVARTTFQKSVAVIKPLRESVLPEYLALFLEAHVQQMKAKSAGTAVKNLLLRDLRSAPIALPPASEQERIVTEVGAFLSVSGELENEVDKSLIRSSRLRQSILADAFSG